MTEPGLHTTLRSLPLVKRCRKCVVEGWLQHIVRVKNLALVLFDIKLEIIAYAQQEVF